MPQGGESAAASYTGLGKLGMTPVGLEAWLVCIGLLLTVVLILWCLSKWGQERRRR